MAFRGFCIGTLQYIYDLYVLYVNALAILCKSERERKREICLQGRYSYDNRHVSIFVHCEQVYHLNLILAF